MSIDRSILSEFIKATNDNKETKQTQLYGTVVTKGNTKCVKIDGSEIVTPVRSITDIKDEERVMVSIKDHMATVTGNMTNPSVGNDRVEFTEGKIDKFDHLFAGNITAENIAANSITADKILAGSITTDKLMAESIIADKIAANAIESKHIKADTIESSHIKANTIESSHIKTNTIESDHIQSNTINSNHINSNTITSDHIVAGSITSENIATGTITAGSGIIAEGAIGSAQISSLDVAKLESGTIDTSKIYIAGADGHLQLKGNRLQVFDGLGDKAIERVSVGDVNGDGSKFGLRVRGVDGETILLDENGVTSEGITDGSITNNKISDDANIDGAKLNINSVVSKINEDGTETIQGTKIEVDGTTLNTKLSTITNKQTEDGERITQAQTQISANTNAIKLKVDEQTYTADKKDMTSKLEKNTSEISTMKGQIALKVEQADIENAKSEIEGVIDTKVDSAKSEIKITTDAISQNVSNLTQTVSNKADGSTVSSLNSKVSSLETSVNGISGKVTSLEKTTTTLGTQVNTANTNASSALNKANSATTTANNAQNSANSANSKIDNLEIGSTNLILGTKDFTIDNSRKKGWYNQGGFTITQDDDCKIATHSASGLTSNAIKGLFSTYIPCKKGDIFTVSVYIKVENVNNWDIKKPFIVEGYNAANTRIEYVDVSINHNGSNNPTLTNNEWTRFVYTYTITNVDTVSFGIRLSLFKNGKISFKKAQIEKGNKVTDWSIASNDLQFQIDTTTTEISKTKSQVSEIKTELNGITSRVSNVETNQTTTNGKVSSLETRMSTAESKITDTAITNVVKESQFIKDMNGNITVNKNNISKIEQTSNSITSSVRDLEGKYTEIKQTVDGIDLTGKVSFSDLSTSGRTTINGANITTGTIDTNKVNIKGNTTRKIVIANDNYCVYDGTETDVNRKVFMGFRPYNSSAQYIPSVMLGYNGINPNVDGAVVSGGTYTTYSHYPNNNNPESINQSYGALAFKYGASGTQFSTLNMYQNGDIDLKAGSGIYFRPSLRNKNNHVFGMSDTEVGCRVPFKCTSTIFTNGDITTDRNIHAYGNISASGSMSCGTILPSNISIGSGLSINSNGIYTTGHITGNMVKTDSYRFTNNHIAFSKSDYNNNMMNGCNWDWQYHNLVNVKVYPVALSLPTIDEPTIQTFSKTQKDTLSQIKFPEARELSVEESAPAIDISDVTNKEEITTNGDVDLIKLVYLLVKDVQTLKQENEIIKAELKELQSK